MPHLDTLTQSIENKTARIAQIGLGYVGLPVAAMFARAGFQTTGLDVDAERVETINQGQNPIQGIEPGLAELIQEVTASGRLHCTTDYNDINTADVVIIAVQTPVEESDHQPRYHHMRAVLESLGPVLKRGALVIIESTIAPGTIQRVIIPTLEQSGGGRAGEDFYIGHCPERVMPGRLLHNITQMDRVAGALTPEIGAVMVKLYGHIVQGTLDVTDILTAELVKTTENAYRDVQIAFANEVARICETLGGDVWRVRELVNKSPGRNMLYPGAGVGGHCIPKDPWLLIANTVGYLETQLIPTARHVNQSMPQHVAQMTRQALESAGVALESAVIAVLGYAYLENSDDTRNSPSQDLIDTLQGQCGELRIHDPFVPDYQGDLDTILTGADAAVILVAHDLYREQHWAEQIQRLRNPILIDARHILPDDFQVDGAQIRVLGKG